jgi:hypothetical protein
LEPKLSQSKIEINDVIKISSLKAQVNYWRTRYEMVIKYAVIEKCPALVSELCNRRINGHREI